MAPIQPRDRITPAAVVEPGDEAHDWLEAHEALSRLAKHRAHTEWEEGRALLAALRAGAHCRLGFGSFFEYVEALFAYKPRSIDEKLRVARALESLPSLAVTLRDGALPWSTVRELTRVATVETEAAWRDAARGKSVRQVEELVAGRKLGDSPDAPADPALRRHVLAFEVLAETFATVREAFAKVRHDAGEPLDEETALLLMARHVLGGPTDEGRASYQIALTVCEQCGRGCQRGHGNNLEVDSAITEMALCDAQHIGHVDFGGEDQAMSARKATTRTPLRSSGVSFRAHVGSKGHVSREANVDSRQVDLEQRHASQAPRARATQTIPPAVRRQVLHRDGHCCVVPRFRNASFLDVHHLTPRAEGGSHDAGKLVVLCSAHHRALHRGRLIAQGSSARTLVFRHADGSPYREPAAPRMAEAHAQAFIALRNLGFRESEVRRALERTRTEVTVDADRPEQIVRAALGFLTPTTNLWSVAP